MEEDIILLLLHHLPCRNQLLLHLSTTLSMVMMTLNMTQVIVTNTATVVVDTKDPVLTLIMTSSATAIAVKDLGLKIIVTMAPKIMCSKMDTAVEINPMLLLTTIQVINQVKKLDIDRISIVPIKKSFLSVIVIEQILQIRHQPQ